MEIGLILIPLLIVVSGAIAYIGNAVGRTIGRGRLTLFGLRPRYTAQVITVATGMLITLVTLATILLVSQDARTVLFRYRGLLSEMRRLEGEIKNAEDRLKQLKGGDIAYRRNQEVLRALIDGTASQRAVQTEVDGLRLRAVDLALRNGINVDGVTGSVLILFPPNLTWENVARLVTMHKGETIVRVIANENTLKGEPLEVSVQLVDNRLAFRPGEILTSAQIDGRKSRDEIGRRVLELVDQTSNVARPRVISSPFAVITELPIPQVDADEVRQTVARIARTGRPVRLAVVAAAEVRTSGPLTVSLRVL